MSMLSRKRVPVFASSLVAVILGFVGGVGLSTRTYAALVPVIVPTPVDSGYKCPDSCTGALCGGTPCKCDPNNTDDCITE